MSTNRIAPKRVRFVEFDDQTDFVIPEDVTALSTEEIDDLLAQAVETATALAAGERTPEVVAAITEISEGVDRLRAEQTSRAEAAAEADASVDALLAVIAPAPEAEVEVDEEEAEVEVETEEVVEEVEAIAASGAREVRVSAALLGNRRPAREEVVEETPVPSIRDHARAASNVSGFSAGQALDFDGMASTVITQMKGYNHKAFAAAASRGEHVQTRLGAFVIDKPVDDTLTVSAADSKERVSEVFNLASDTSRLPEGTLTAAGWCAPSERLYDLYDMGESTAGMLDLPEVTIRRGGIEWALGADFSDIYANSGWDYTEAEAEANDWNGAGGGSKPCFVVDCPEFDEARLDAVGLCIQAGLLQRVGYPEAIADVVKKALIAHAHRVNAKKILSLVAQSTTVNLPATQVGATAPILTAVELQATHYRYSHLLDPGTVLEAVFPLWVHGVVRSDLSRRLGLAEFDVPNARINAWFAQRGIRPQFVYDWQSLSVTGATGFTAWPQNVSFLLYKAGTFVAGGADVLTVDTMYDSTLLGQNDYTALWTEEGILVAKRGLDSRLVTTSIVADGATHIGVDITRTGV